MEIFILIAIAILALIAYTPHNAMQALLTLFWACMAGMAAWAVVEMAISLLS